MGHTEDIPVVDLSVNHRIDFVQLEVLNILIGERLHLRVVYTPNKLRQVAGVALRFVGKYRADIYVTHGHRRIQA